MNVVNRKRIEFEADRQDSPQSLVRNILAGIYPEHAEAVVKHSETDQSIDSFGNKMSIHEAHEEARIMPAKP